MNYNNEENKNKSKNQVCEEYLEEFGVWANPEKELKAFYAGTSIELLGKLLDLAKIDEDQELIAHYREVYRAIS